MQIKHLVHYIIYCLRVDISDNEREAFLFAVLALPALVYCCVQSNETTSSWEMYFSTSQFYLNVLDQFSK